MKRLTIFLLLALAGFGAGAAAWTLKKETAHLKIYTADVENSNFKAVKVECYVEATPSQVMAVLLDIDRQKDWVFNDKSSKMLKKVNDSELLYYSEVSVPWPCNNRDFISRLKVVQPAAGTIIIETHAEPAYLPEKAGLVRVKTSSARWVLTALPGKETRIEYTLQFDPGGGVPAWLTNMFITKGPSETFEKLPGRLLLPAYQNVHYAFIK
jgi:hypothetical protein